MQSAETRQATDAREHRLIVAGFGGQGILTLAKVLCTAAMGEGKTVTYLPSYGSEVRGGTANCQLVVSRGPIYSPLVEAADSLIILNQLSYERFADRIKPSGLLVVNSSTVDVDSVEGPPEGRLIVLPATDRAAELGNVRVANVLMLGAFITASALATEESCLAALKELIGRRRAHLVDLNVKALKEGAALAGG